jgi:hypothetical protein
MTVVLAPRKEIVRLFPQGQSMVLLGIPPSIKGDKGDDGDPGDSASRYVHTQALASETWLVNHNFGFFPSASVFTTGGLEIEAEVQNLNVNQTEIRLSVAMSGYAIFQ